MSAFDDVFGIEPAANFERNLQLSLDEKFESPIGGLRFDLKVEEYDENEVIKPIKNIDGQQKIFNDSASAIKFPILLQLIKILGDDFKLDDRVPIDIKKSDLKSAINDYENFQNGKLKLWTNPEVEFSVARYFYNTRYANFDFDDSSSELELQIPIKDLVDMLLKPSSNIALRLLLNVYPKTKGVNNIRSIIQDNVDKIVGEHQVYIRDGMKGNDTTLTNRHTFEGLSQLMTYSFQEIDNLPIEVRDVIKESLSELEDDRVVELVGLDHGMRDMLREYDLVVMDKSGLNPTYGLKRDDSQSANEALKDGSWTITSTDNPYEYEEQTSIGKDYLVVATFNDFAIVEDSDGKRFKVFYEFVLPYTSIKQTNDNLSAVEEEKKITKMKEIALPLIKAEILRQLQVVGCKL